MEGVFKFIVHRTQGSGQENRSPVPNYVLSLPKEYERYRNSREYIGIVSNSEGTRRMPWLSLFTYLLCYQWEVFFIFSKICCLHQ